MTDRMVHRQVVYRLLPQTRGRWRRLARISVHWRRYADKDRLFRKRRSDRQTRVSVNLLHRALQYRGFAPYVGVFVERNRSSIPINAYRNRGGVLGVSKTF